MSLKEFVITKDPAVWALLSPRERQVFQGVVRGFTDREIGRQLKIAEATVKVHLRGAYLKCGVGRRTALIGRVYRLPEFLLGKGDDVAAKPAPAEA